MSARPVSLLATFGLILALSGCGGCTNTAQLEPGVYEDNVILYTADQAIGDGFDTLHAFVSWEYTNRVSLARWPDVKKSADFVRANVAAWRNAVISARDAYAAVPTEGNRVSLQQAIAVIRSALVTAATHQTQHPEVESP